MMHPHLMISGALILLAIGYWVLTLAAKQEKGLKTLGNVFGWIITIISILMIIGAICWMLMMPHMMKHHMMWKEGMMGNQTCSSQNMEMKEKWEKKKMKHM